MARSIDKIRAMRELLNLIVTFVDAYLELRESIRQLICWYEIFRKEREIR